MNISHFFSLRKVFLSAVIFGLLCSKIFAQTGNLEIVVSNAKRASELIEVEAYDEAEKLISETLELSMPDTLLAMLENQYSMTLGYKGEFEKALERGHHAVALYQKHFGEQKKQTIDALYNLGELHGGTGNYDSLFFYLEKSLELYYRHTPEEYADIGLVHNNLAANYRNREFYRKAIIHFRKAVENWEKVAEERTDYLIIGYENLGAYLDTDESLSYLQKALDLKISQGANPFRSYIEIAGKHSTFENYSESLRYYHIGLKLLKPLADNQKETGFNFQYDLAITYSLVAQAHEGLEQYDSARYYYQLAYEVPTIANDPSLQTRYLTAQANLYRYMGDNDKSITDLLRILPQTSNPDNYMFGYVTYSLSKVFEVQGDFENALLYNLFSLRYDAHGSKSLAPDSTIRIFNRNELSLQSNAAILLANHALFLKKLAGQKPEEKEEILKVALSNIEQAVAHFEEVGESEYASLFYKRGFDKALETQQSILLALFEITQNKQFVNDAFRVSEQAKINKTLLYFNDQEVRALAELPEDVFDRDRKLKGEIAEVERSIFKESQLGLEADSTSLRSAYNQLFQLKRDYENFENQLREKFPKYFELKHNIAPVDFREIQQQLDNETTALAYSLHESFLFIYTITQQGISAQQFETAAVLKNQIETYRGHLLNPSVSPLEFSASAYALYQALISPVSAKIKSTKNLLIIPDKEISTVPFETFVTSQQAENGFSNLSYLLHQFEIHYAYSATLWHKQLHEKDNKAREFWAGFAPDYDTNESISTNYSSSKNEWISILPGAQKEVEELSELMNGTLFSGESANKSALLKAGKDYKVLHLAMHSTINSDQPMYSSFLFTPNLEDDAEQLSISELFHQDLNSELVVLSACNTGYGRLLPGEGVLSLSQAFTAAGCPSTLMSLWMVPDQETKVLMNHFYQGIKAEESKSQALHMAKIDYLKEATNDRMAHPFYWAGFVLSGNEKAIVQPKDYKELFAGLGILGLVLGILFLKRRKKTMLNQHS